MTPHSAGVLPHQNQCRRQSRRWEQERRGGGHGQLWEMIGWGRGVVVVEKREVPNPCQDWHPQAHTYAQAATPCVHTDASTITASPPCKTWLTTQFHWSSYLQGISPTHTHDIGHNTTLVQTRGAHIFSKAMYKSRRDWEIVNCWKRCYIRFCTSTAPKWNSKMKKRACCLQASPKTAPSLCIYHLLWCHSPPLIPCLFIVFCLALTQMWRHSVFTKLLIPDVINTWCTTKKMLKNTFQKRKTNFQHHFLMIGRASFSG